MSAAKSLPAYAAIYDKVTTRRTDGSVWLSAVVDRGDHYAVIETLIQLPRRLLNPCNPVVSNTEPQMAQ